jgi:hypothetical protein
VDNDDYVIAAAYLVLLEARFRVNTEAMDAANRAGDRETYDACVETSRTVYAEIANVRVALKAPQPR